MVIASVGIIGGVAAIEQESEPKRFVEVLVALVPRVLDVDDANASAGSAAQPPSGLGADPVGGCAQVALVPSEVRGGGGSWHRQRRRLDDLDARQRCQGLHETDAAASGRRRDAEPQVEVGQRASDSGESLAAQHVEPLLGNGKQTADLRAGMRPGQRRQHATCGCLGAHPHPRNRGAELVTELHVEHRRGVAGGNRTEYRTRLRDTPGRRGRGERADSKDCSKRNKSQQRPRRTLGLCHVSPFTAE